MRITAPGSRINDRTNLGKIRRLAIAAAAIPVTTLIVLLMPSIAQAQVADPLTGAQGSIDGVLGTLTTYGPVVGGMYLLYAIASALVARYRADSWLAQGKRLAFITGTLGVTGAALQAQIAGSPWTVIAAAAAAMMFKLLTPTVTPVVAKPVASPDSPASPASPASTTKNVVTAALVALVVSCGGAPAGDRGAAGLQAGLSCEEPSVVSFVIQALPILIKAVVATFRGDGTIDGAALAVAARPMKDVGLQCAMDAAIAAATTPTTAASTAATLASATPKTNTATTASATTASASAASTPTTSQALSDANRRTWEEIRTKLGWAKPAATSNGG